MVEFCTVPGACETCLHSWTLGFYRDTSHTAVIREYRGKIINLLRYTSGWTTSVENLELKYNGTNRISVWAFCNWDISSPPPKKNTLRLYFLKISHQGYCFLIIHALKRNSGFNDIKEPVGAVTQLVNANVSLVQIHVNI